MNLAMAGLWNWHTKADWSRGARRENMGCIILSQKQLEFWLAALLHLRREGLELDGEFWGPSLAVVIFTKLLLVSIVRMESKPCFCIVL